MHFSKLRLIGFKSFVEPTDFLIEPGLTGVVGPNGCGKSNLVEALRWVMGDHSYKSMRASGMNDVIFSGAGQRPARNVAEVGLTLDNSSRTAPAAFNDAEVLEVTRRIEREAGSTYRVNGREVRARDVQILFADAASGARSPSLVRQGQVSEIISAKPQARRRILEDAAGVAGLHTRRHEAELRLKGAEDNLARIADVIAQITSQGDGLRRQVRQAQRYRGLQAEIRRTQALVALVEHEDAHQEVEEAKARLAEASAAVVTCTQAQGEAARHQAVAAHGLPDLRDREVAAGTTLQRVIVARETLDGEERRAKARSDELNRRIAEMTRDLGRDASVLEDACAVLERLASEEMELQGAVKDAGAEDDLRRRLTSTEAARVAAETRVAAAQTRHAEAQAERRALASRLKDEEGRLARHAQDFAASQKARDTLVTQAGAGESLEAQIAKLESAKAALAELETVTREAEAAMAAAREVEQAGRAPLFEADRHVQRLETEIRTLSKLLETSGEQQWPPIVDLIHVAAGYEAALGAALGDDLDASADPQAPAHWAVSEARGDGALPDGAEPLSRFVEAPAALARRLAQIGLVEKQAGEAMRAALGPGQRLVSIQGDLWRWDGFTQAADSPTPAALRLVERNRLTELRAEAAQARDALAELKASAGAAQEHLRACLTREAGTRSSLQGARRVFEAAREAHAARERKAIEAAARLAALDAESAKLRSARDEADRKVGDIRAALAALAPAGAGEEELEMSRVELTSRHAAETEARALCQAIDRDREVKSKRLAAIATERASWLSRREHAQAHHLDLAGRLEAARTEHVGMSENPDAFVLARRRLLGEAEAAETALRAASDARTRAETDLAAADRGARATLEAMSAAREGNARCEARLEAANQRLDALVRQVATELECAPTALCSLAGLKPDAPRPPLAQIMARLEGLKDDRERLGAVNLRADEELGALEAQRQGLDKEKADLTEAIRRLRQAIGSLNREGRERLLGAFATVNGHFKELFTSLFGGGTAELQLVESDDPLEAGLEIVARPPGKKTQVMTLLSGGEQALTSISLIFAVFLTNPSPICVLDEVDAPLDDANVERLCDLVDAMRKKTDTRFIAITHNPLTMARMDRLYGVTQTEPGVSQLVSVDLARAEQMLEAS